MSALPLFTLVILLTRNSHCYRCLSSQTVDTHLICKIFETTDIENKIPHDFSSRNYCKWGYTDTLIGCEAGSTEDINIIEIEYTNGINGTLNFEYQWPTHLKELDLEQSSSSSFNLYGEWNWESIQLLDDLIELDLEGNEFSGIIGDTEWNIIASMQSLTDLTLTDNNFETNFSEITINTLSNIIEMELSDNNFYGTINLESGGFFSKFPDLQWFLMESNDIYGYFENLDVISTEYLSNLKEFKLGNNHFSGHISLSKDRSLSPSLTHFEIYNNQFEGPVDWDIFANLNLEVIDIGGNLFSGLLSMSHSLSLPDTLQHIDIDYNDFHDQIDWNIFANLYNLTELRLNDNSFTGTIDWNIISDLHSNGQLSNLNFRDNHFTGYADFSWIDDNKLKYLDLDLDIPCDPEIYRCLYGTQTHRKNRACYTRAQCETTCACSHGDDYIITNHNTPSPTATTSSDTMYKSSTLLNISIETIAPDSIAVYFNAETNGVYLHHAYLLLIGSIILFCCVLCVMVIFTVYWKGQISQHRLSDIKTRHSTVTATPTQKVLSVSCTEFSIRPTIRVHASTITTVDNHHRTPTPAYIQAQQIIAVAGKTRRKTTYEGPEGHEDSKFCDEDDDAKSDEFTIESLPVTPYDADDAVSPSFDGMGEEYALKGFPTIDKMNEIKSINPSNSALDYQGPGTIVIEDDDDIATPSSTMMYQDDNKEKSLNLNSVALTVMAMMRMMSTKSVIQKQ